jgi:site-specific DNA recombinase
MKPAKTIAATYARVSLPGQTDNFSLPSQRRAMLKLAAEKGYRVPKEFEFVDGGCLGGEMDRPEFCRMRELVRGQQVKAVICYDTDRLVRGLHLQLLVEEECEKFGVALEYVMLPTDASPEGKMLRQMKGVFGEYEKAKFKERSSRGRKEKLQAGFFPSGRALYGYVRLGRKQEKKGELEVIPAQGKIVKQIFQKADEGAALIDIARALTEDAVPTATGAPWSKTVLSAMLRNSTYKGEAQCNRRMVAEPVTRRKPPAAGKSKKTSQKARPASDWIMVKTPAIIDPKLFDRVQERLVRDRHVNSGRPSPYILRGLLKCGVCGFSCCTFPNHGKPRYRCNNIDRLTYKRNCQQPSVSVEQIETAVWNEVIYTFEDPARILKLANDQWAALAKTDKQVAKERAELERTIEQLKRREFRAAQALLDADIADSRQQFRDALKTMQSQRRSQEARLAQLQPVQQPAFDLDKYCQQVARWRKLKDPEPKREVLRQVIERIELKDGEVAIYFRLGGGNSATNRLDRKPDARADDLQAAGDRHPRRDRGRSGADDCTNARRGRHARVDRRRGRTAVRALRSGRRDPVRIVCRSPSGRSGN